MIFYIVFLTVIPQYCEMIYSISNANVIITKINMDLFTIKKGGFRGINRKIHAELCEDLGNALVTPFEPLPIEREFFVLRKNENFSPPHDPSTLQPEDIASSSQSQDIPSSSQSYDLKLTHFVNISPPSQKKGTVVVDKIFFGVKKKVVTTISCKFHDFRLYLVPVTLFHGYILLLQTEDMSTGQIPIGITLPKHHLHRIERKAYNTFSAMIKFLKDRQAEKNIPVLFTPMNENTNMAERKKLKNFQLCSSFFSRNNINFHDGVKMLTASMTYVISPEIDSLKCHFANMFTFQIYEHPTEKHYIFVSHQLCFQPYALEYYLIRILQTGLINL